MWNAFKVSGLTAAIYVQRAGLRSLVLEEYVYGGQMASTPEIENYPLHPLRDVRKKKGTLDEIIKEFRETEKDDYISITLTDEIDPYKPKEQLERIFSHILEIRVDNQRTRTKLKEMDEELVMKDPFTSFAEFYKEMQGREMNGEEETIMKEIFDKAKGVE